MRPTRIDVMMFVYTLGAVLSGGLVAVEAGSSDRVFLVILSLIVAVPWTLYFRFRMAPRLKEELEEDETATTVGDRRLDS